MPLSKWQPSSSPERFSGKDKDWADFSVAFTNYMGAVHAAYPSMLDIAEKHKTELRMEDLTDAQKALPQQLFCILGLPVRGSGL